MASRASLKPKPRRALRSAAHHPIAKSSLNLGGIAMSRPAIAAFYVLGAAGLTALAVALVGPQRLQREVIQPLRGAIEPQAEKLWADSKPLREQLAGLFRSASPSGRERLVRSFQSWAGHFHAS